MPSNRISLFSGENLGFMRVCWFGISSTAASGKMKELKSFWAGNSQWFIRVQIFPLCTELGRRCWVNGQSVFTQQAFNHIQGKGFPCQIQR